MTTSAFDAVPAYGGDPILSLMESFQADTHAHKVSLGIGLYFDEYGRVPVLKAVREAAAELAGQARPSTYLPMEGLASYRQGLQQLVFGAESRALAERRIATIQSVGGSGALKVGADFIRRHFPAAQVWVSDPTWENHLAIFEGAGLEVRSYPYYDPATGGLRFDAMLQAIAALPRGSIVLLHASCHNPTGVDLTREQWRDLIPLMAKNGLMPFVDMAYQGFGEGIAEDAWSVRALEAAGLEFLVANSFSKNFSLYGERVGGLSVVCASTSAADRVLGQLKATVRRNYSSPPAHGAEIVSRILASPTAMQSWQDELAGMRARIWRMREQLHAALQAHFKGRRSFEFLLKQRGMFSYTGLEPDQVQHLKQEHGVYLVGSGRLCVSGLSESNVAHVAQAIAAACDGRKA
jgi:aromatic-amino-acid transaminase